jgi:hypothetical protein
MIITMGTTKESNDANILTHWAIWLRFELFAIAREKNNTPANPPNAT